MNNQHWVHSPLVSTLSIGKFNSIYSAAPFKASRLGNFEEVRGKNNTTTKPAGRHFEFKEVIDWAFDFEEAVLVLSSRPR